PTPVLLRPRQRSAPVKRSRPHARLARSAHRLHAAPRVGRGSGDVAILSAARARSGHAVQGGTGHRRGDLRRSRARVPLRGDATGSRRAWSDREPRRCPVPPPCRAVWLALLAALGCHPAVPPPNVVVVVV